MARKKGVSTFVKIPLSKLNDILSGFPDVKISVGKGNIAELESALDVDFGLSEDEVDTGAVASSGEVAELGGMKVD